MSNLDRLDLDAVFTRLNEAKLPDWDTETVAVAVVKAVDEWVKYDAAYRDVLMVEQAGSNELGAYRVDLVLNERDTDKIVVVDWKTKGSKLDDRWRLRETRSWQPRIYAAMVARVFGWPLAVPFSIDYEIRGVRLDEVPELATIHLELTEADAQEGVRYLQSVAAQRRALGVFTGEPWTRNPAGCRCFGDAYACEFERYCWEHETILYPDDWTKGFEAFHAPLSYSSSQEFLRCPERYRLGKILGYTEDFRARVGIVFHEAMAEIYRGCV